MPNQAWATTMQLTVIKTFAIAELGTIVFVGMEPIPLACGTCHRFLITGPGGNPVEAVASVESVRSEASGVEFSALLFASLSVRELAIGSSISILGEVRDP